jgi:hypothetical protein
MGKPAAIMLLFAQLLATAICSFLKQHGSVNVTVVEPLTKEIPVTQAEGASWFSITFPLGTFQSPIARALKHVIGYIPAHIARLDNEGELS